MKKSPFANPAVSVIVPVFNSAPFLDDCIRSLLGQTLRDIEIIFVDDLSTDESPAILSKYAALYPSIIKVIRLSEKGFQGGARNAGIRAARGTYLGFCDSDDLAHPDLYKTLLERITASQADLAVAQYAAVPEKCTLSDVQSLDLSPYVTWSPLLTRWDGLPLDDQARCDVIALEKGGLCVWLIKKVYYRGARHLDARMPL